MKKIYYFIPVTFLLLGTVLQAQVLVDSAGSGSFVNKGATYTVPNSANIAQVYIMNGGTCTNGVPAMIRSVMVDSGGYFKFGGENSDVDTIIVNQGGKADMAWRSRIGKYALFNSGSVIDFKSVSDFTLKRNAVMMIDTLCSISNISYIRLNESCSIINGTPLLSIAHLSLQSENAGYYGYIYLSGYPFVVNRISIVERIKTYLSLGTNLTINNEINNTEDLTGILLNGYLLSLGSNIQYTGLKSTFIDFKNGGYVFQKLNTTTSVTHNVRDVTTPAGVTTDTMRVSIKVDTNGTFGANPGIYFEVIADSVLYFNGARSALSRNVYIEQQDITAIDYQISFNYKASEVIGSKSTMFSSVLDTDSSYWRFGSPLVASVQFSGDFEGYLTARSTYEPRAELSSAPLIENTMDGKNITIMLRDAVFADATLNKANFQFNNAPAGVSVDSIIYNDERSATVILGYDGTDFDTDSSHVYLSISGAEIFLSIPIISDTLLMDAVVEVQQAEVAENNTKPAIYPNPATESITVKTPASTGQIEMINMLGIVVKSVVITAGNTIINVENLPKGNYIVRITGPSVTDFSKLIIQ